MKHQVTKQCLMAAIFLTVTPAIGCSAGNDRHQGPPPEAIQACKDKEVGDTVEFIDRRGETLKATCKEIDGQVAAMPEGMENDRHQGPPPEAIQACKDKEVGDTVEFIGRRGETLKATCQEIDGQVAAMPEGMENGRPPKP